MLTSQDNRMQHDNTLVHCRAVHEYHILMSHTGKSRGKTRKYAYSRIQVSLKEIFADPGQALGRHKYLPQVLVDTRSLYILIMLCCTTSKNLVYVLKNDNLSYKIWYSKYYFAFLTFQVMLECSNVHLIHCIDV